MSLLQGIGVISLLISLASLVTRYSLTGLPDSQSPSCGGHAGRDCLRQPLQRSNY